MPMDNQHKLPSIQTADWLNMSDDTLEVLVIVFFNNHTYNKVNTLLTQIYSLEIGSVPSCAKGRRQAAPGGARPKGVADLRCLLLTYEPPSWQKFWGCADN